MAVVNEITSGECKIYIYDDYSHGKTEHEVEELINYVSEIIIRYFIRRGNNG